MKLFGVLSTYAFHGINTDLFTYSLFICVCVIKLSGTNLNQPYSQKMEIKRKTKKCQKTKLNTSVIYIRRNFSVKKNTYFLLVIPSF